MADAASLTAVRPAPSPSAWDEGRVDRDFVPAHAPPWYDQAIDTHIVTRHSDALLLLRSPSVAVDTMTGYRRALAGGAEAISSLERLLSGFTLYLNGPRHEVARRWQVSAWRAIERELSPAVVADTTGAILAELPRGVPVEAMAAICDRLPPALLARALGAREDVVAVAGHGVARLMEAAQRGHTRESLLALEREARDLETTALPLVTAAVRKGILGAQNARRVPGREPDGVHVLLFLVGAAVHTTAGLLGNALALVLLDDGIRSHFDGRSPPTRRAMRELVRLGSSVRYAKSRLTTATVEGPDWTLPRGSRFVIDLEQVARDPVAHPEPRRFLPDAVRAQPLAFGTGPHACVGANTGLVIVETALRTTLAEGRPTLAGAEVRWERRTMFRRPATLPVELGAAPPAHAADGLHATGGAHLVPCAGGER